MAGNWLFVAILWKKISVYSCCYILSHHVGYIRRSHSWSIYDIWLYRLYRGYWRKCPALSFFSLSSRLGRPSITHQLQLATIPILPMVLCNTPYRSPWTFQLMLLTATWILPDLGIIEMYTCNFFGVVYGNDNSYCADRTMFTTFASAIGEQTLAILALGQNRTMASLGVVQFFALMGGLLFGRTTPPAFYRDSVYCEWIKLIEAIWKTDINSFCLFGLFNSHQLY